MRSLKYKAVEFFSIFILAPIAMVLEFPIMIKLGALVLVAKKISS